MSEADPLTTEAAETDRLRLDPFGFHAGVASRIQGLGGDMPGLDPAYVFHTHYIDVAQGPAEFSVTFDNLRAKRGTLVLRVHMLPKEPGAHARLANSSRISLNRLVFQGGKTSIGFEGFRGVSYALYATIPDDSDVTAKAITIELDWPREGLPEDEIFIDGRNSRFTAPTVANSKLLSTTVSRIATPISQCATKFHLREEPARAWLHDLADDPSVPTDAARWNVIYVLQALRCYGLMEPGARGLGFGVQDSPLPAILAQRGVSLVATVPNSAESSWDEAEHAQALQRLHRPRLCQEDRFARHVEVRASSLYPIPRDLVNFDFFWSSGVVNRLGAISAGVRFIDEAMGCLRPGGVAVHTFDIDRSPSGPSVEDDALTLFRRADVERAALILISRNHEVAQISLDDRRILKHQIRDPTSGASLEAAPFGLLARKAASAL